MDARGGREERTCSALTTSMITPPLSIRARPALTAKLDCVESPLVLPSWTPLVVGSVVAIVDVN